MKKIVLTTCHISDSQYEKLCFEALHEKKSIQEVIRERIFYKPFHDEVERAYDSWIDRQLKKIMKE